MIAAGVEGLESWIREVDFLRACERDISDACEQCAFLGGCLGAQVEASGGEGCDTAPQGDTLSQDDARPSCKACRQGDYVAKSKGCKGSGAQVEADCMAVRGVTETFKESHRATMRAAEHDMYVRSINCWAERSRFGTYVV